MHSNCSRCRTPIIYAKTPYACDSKKQGCWPSLWNSYVGKGCDLYTEFKLKPHRDLLFPSLSVS